MKKIMFMIESMIVGGAEKALINIVNNLDKNKYDVTVISMYKNSVYDGYNYNFKELFNENIHVKYLIDNSKQFRYKVFNFLYNKLPKKWFYKFFIKEDYDIEIATYEGFPTTFLSNSINRKSKKIAWLHTNSNNAFGNLDKENLNKVGLEYEKFDKIVGVSKSVVDSFNNIFNMDIKTEVQYNILDENEIIRKSKENISEIKVTTDFKMVTVGRLIPVKGYDRLLRCIKKLKDDGLNFQLWIIGDGDERVNLKNYIKNNKLEDYVKLLGFQDNPYKFIRQSDLFVCSSIAEGFSTVATEAVILEKPIITTDCSGMKELFGEYKCGIITNNDDESLYKGLKEVLENKEMINVFIENSKKRKIFFNKITRVEELEELLG